MGAFIEFCKLNEARRNPEMNPKVSAYEALEQYKDDPDIYISFTEDFTSNSSKMSMTRTRTDVKLNKSSMKNQSKIGINPKSGFTTPLGIYCYPLSIVWERYAIDRHKTLTILPFASTRPHIYILRAKDVGTSFINDMYTDYGSNKFDKDVKILKQLWIAEIPKFGKKTYQYIEYQKEINNQTLVLEYYINQLDVDEDDKKIKDKIHSIQTKLSELKQKQKDYMTNELWNIVYERALEDAREKNAIMSFWKLANLMAFYMTGQKEGITSSTKWNYLLRKCGYSGFADKSGRGYIHSAEPIQAVFLTKNAFAVVGKVDNKDYEKHKLTVGKKDSQHTMDIIKNEDELMYKYNSHKLGLPLVPAILLNKSTYIQILSYPEFIKSMTDKNLSFLLKKLYEYEHDSGINLSLQSKIEKIQSNINKYGLGMSSFPKSQKWFDKISDGY